MSSVLSKFNHIFFHSGVDPLDGVTWSGPPSQATEFMCVDNKAR